MNKYAKIIISGIIAFLIYVFLFQPIIEVVKYRHKFVLNDYRHFLWLLNDSVKLDNSIGSDTFFSVSGHVREWDQYFNYNLEGGNDIHIFEFKDLGLIKIKDIKFDYQEDFNSFKNVHVTVFNKDIDAWPVVTIKYRLPFHNYLNVNFNKNANLSDVRNSKNCKAVFGNLSTMSLNNEENEPLVLFDFTKTIQTFIVFYTTESRFFLILITSDHPMNESYINILNLKCVD